MLYLLAILVPPLAMFVCGKVFQGILCIPLTLMVLSWPLAAIWAVCVVSQHRADQRHKELLAIASPKNCQR